MISAEKQLLVVLVIFTLAILTTAALVALGALDSNVFTAIVGAVVGAVAGMLNPQTGKPSA